VRMWEISCREYDSVCLFGRVAEVFYKVVNDFRNSADKRFVFESSRQISEGPSVTVSINFDGHHGV